jgi:Fe-S cluster assembly protein SufB
MSPDTEHLGEKRRAAAVAEKSRQETFERDSSKYDFKDPEKYVYKAKKGISRDIVEEISAMKGEPRWMLEKRLESLEIFLSKPTPTWGGDLSGLKYEDMSYYIKPTEEEGRSWDEVPDRIKQTFEKLGIPEAERKFLAGAGAQYESEAVYHNLKEEWAKKGVIFMDSDSGLKEHPEIYQQYWGTVVPANDNKFAALNTAFWSGGSFVYIPEGVSVDIPLQAYFRINSANMGQFERTLIIADKGSKVHYIEGCTAPTYSSRSLHSGVIEIIVKEGAQVRYTTLQNWATNLYNLVTQRSLVHQDASMEWVDANLGSHLTMKYPSCYLLGKGAKGEILSVSYAGSGQHQDTGGKVIHAAPYTTSRITSKSISKDGGRASYRGLVKVAKGAVGVKSNVMCDALLLDERSRSDTYPYIEIDEDHATVGHEATVGKVGEDQIFYLMSRGLSEADALSMIVLGFMEPFTRNLPMEYAVEFNRLIQLEMSGSVG